MRLRIGKWTVTMASEQASKPVSVEPASTGSALMDKLRSEGVFKGFDGIEGLLNADEWWQQQPYGTRLYYGDGIADYLHRGVLKAVVRILKGPNVPVSHSEVATGDVEHNEEGK